MKALQLRKARDVGIKCTSTCGNFRIIAATTTEIVKQTMKAHKFPPLVLPPGTRLENSRSSGSEQEEHTTPTQQQFDDQQQQQQQPPDYRSEQAELLATSTTWTNMMALTLRDEERFQLRVLPSADWIGGIPMVESLALGECRANYSDLHVPGAVDPETSSAGNIEENPTSYTTFVQRIMYHHKEPVTSATSCLVNSRRGMGNMTPHAQQFLTQSEGIPSAVLLLSCYDYSRQEIAWSGGVMVQAIAPAATEEGEEGESEALKLIEYRQAIFDTIWWCPQAHLLPKISSVGDDGKSGTGGQVATTDGVSSSSSSFLAQSESKLLEDLHKRHTHGGLMIHDLMSLATFAPSSKVSELCKNNRLNYPEEVLNSYGGSTVDSSDEKYKEMVEDIKTDYLPAEFRDYVKEKAGGVIEIQTDSLVKTPLDFFCRCSKNTFLGSIHALGKEECVRLRDSADPAGPGTPMRCTFCAKTHYIEHKDWSEVMERFSPAA